MSTIQHIDQFFEGCTNGNMDRMPFLRDSEHVLDLVYGDHCGPISLATMRGNNYFLLIVDDHNRYMWLEVLRIKDEVFRFFRKIKVIADT